MTEIDYDLESVNELFLVRIPSKRAQVRMLQSHLGGRRKLSQEAGGGRDLGERGEGEEKRGT
jgi:hypothetical protein